MRIKLETIVGFFIVVAASIFLFISFKIGIWRLDTVRYANYIVYFSDVSGLNEKSDVTIAGVKVGWINKLTLISRNKQVRIDFMIDKSSLIYANAHALIRQNGILGTKYIEIIPGDPIYSVLPSGSTLMQPSKPSVSIDEILSTIKDIADNINSVTNSLKDIIDNNENSKSIFKLVENAQSAFKSFENIAEKTNLLIQKNDKNIEEICENLASTLNKLRDSLPEVVCDTKKGVNEISKSNLKSNICFKFFYPKVIFYFTSLI